jgi:ABC-type amino acid transport substrate-binding protein
MAGTTRTLTCAAISIALIAWIWVLGAILFGLRWRAIERPGPAIRQLFPYGEMRVGVDASYPPFAVATGNDIFGLDIDVARAIGKRLNVPVRFINMGFDGLYDSLKVDQVDVLISALSVDYSRSNEVLYSLPYFNAGLVLVTHHSSPIQRMSDLSTHSLAFEFGSEADQVSRIWLRRIPPFRTQAYETADYALDTVRLRAADAALVDAISAGLYRRRHPDWAANYDYVTDTLYAAAIRINRWETYAAINEALQSLLDDGTLEAIVRRWL